MKCKWGLWEEVQGWEGGTSKTPHALQTGEESHFGSINDQKRLTMQWKKKYQSFSFRRHMWVSHIIRSQLLLKILQLPSLCRWAGLTGCIWECCFLLGTTGGFDCFSLYCILSIAAYGLHKLELLNYTFWLDFFRSRRDRHCGKGRTAFGINNRESPHLEKPRLTRYRNPP